jgi:hypothetical protein
MKRNVELLCVRCQAPFKAMRRTAKYCSGTCKNYVHLQKKFRLTVNDVTGAVPDRTPTDTKPTGKRRSPSARLRDEYFG